MTRTFFWLVFVALTGPLASLPAIEPDASNSDASKSRSLAVSADRFEDFSLPTSDHGTVAFSADPSVKLHVICFLGTECPLARVYGPRLERMSVQYAQRGVRFIGVNSSVQDSMADLRGYISQHEISFPIGKDYDCTVALQAGASRTPEVFVVDRSGVIQYQGRIDDQYQPGISRNEAKVHDLRDAIEELLAGKSVSKSRTEAVGCLIALPREQSLKSDITFCDQVIRILQRNCIECHRRGQIGPFPLDDYDEVVGWGDMSLEVIDQGRMPPWHADPSVGQFANARFMPAAEKEILRAWVEAGMPFGDAGDLPPQQQYHDGWRMPKDPDLILQMSERPYSIPAEGTVEYQYFVVDPGFTEETWIRAAQVMPGNTSVVHHCIVFQRPPDGAYLKGVGIMSGYVPGQVTTALPEGYAYRVSAGAHLVFQMHYTPNGKPQQDLTRLGLVFAKPEQVTHEVYVINGINTEFEIPPGAANHIVDGEVNWFPTDGVLLAITPHMHVRGKRFELSARSSDRETTLLRVPAYDFNWQHDYDLATPLPLNDIDKLSFQATFDNSAANPFNPDPSEYVLWGDQTWEEMAVVFLRVAQPLDRAGKDINQLARPEENESRRTLKWKLALQFADKYIAQFDRNHDQLLSPHEVPQSVRAFRFHRYDHDNDGYLTRDEMAANALNRFQAASSAGPGDFDGRRKF